MSGLRAYQGIMILSRYPDLTVGASASGSVFGQTGASPLRVNVTSLNPNVTASPQGEVESNRR